jgi:hypothetical protein
MHRDDKEELDRPGDVLGIADTPVPKSPSDPVTEFDEASIARRRARAAGAEDTPGATDMPRGSGATGIDMGSGGSGTDVE